MDLLKIAKKNKDLSKKKNKDLESVEKNYSSLSKTIKNTGFHKNVSNFEVVKKPIIRSSRSPK
jgi:hypothetical protein